MTLSLTLSAEEVIQQDQAYVLATYGRAPFVLTHGSGMTVYDTDGRAYLDFTSGIAVNALGHADPEIAAAIAEQALKLGHVSNLYLTAPQADLAKSLVELSFADKVFFCNSGTEANEAAIKFARKYGKSISPTKTQIVAFSDSFHGRTVGALSVTAKEKYQAAFRPLMPEVHFAPFNDIEASLALITADTCAVILEPVQGEGGVHPAEPDFLQALRNACNQVGALLIFDEVQCGLGRTGKLWAHQHSGVEPDIMTLAKALGGGLPMGAALITNKVAAHIEAGDHASTFGGGAIVARAAQVMLQRVSDPEMLAHVTAMGDLLQERLSELNSPHIKEVRGLGLMLGLELDQEAKPIIQAGYEHGIILINAGPNVLRLVPPLIVNEQDIDHLITALTAILGA